MGLWVPEGTTKVRAYEFCNTHGLFQGEEVEVKAENIRAGARPWTPQDTCSASHIAVFGGEKALPKTQRAPEARTLQDSCH